MNLNEFKAIIFDFDGVIVNSNKLKAEAFKILFIEVLNLNNKEYERFIASPQNNIGINRFEKFKWLHVNLAKFSSIEINDFLKKCNEEYRRISFGLLKNVEVSTFFDGIQNVEENFFIVSAAYQADLRLLIKDIGLDRVFNEQRVFGSPKSKSQNIEFILNQNNYDLNSVLLIGDSESDLEVAKQFNLQFLFVSAWSSENEFIIEKMRFNYNHVDYLSKCEF